MKKILLALIFIGTCTPIIGQYPTAASSSIQPTSDTFNRFAEGFRMAGLCMLGVYAGQYIRNKIAEAWGSSSNQTPSDTNIKASVPTTKLKDLLGDKPEELASTLKMLRNPTAYTQMGLDLPRGILLYGPPGTGKTAYARAIANKLNAYFFEAGSELIGTYYGETAQRIHQLFQDARNLRGPVNKRDNSIHVVIFIDELDSIGVNRNNADKGSKTFLGQATNTLLEELTKEHDNKNILFIGATNHKDKLDPSLLRPGRLDQLIEIKKPNDQSRKEILEHYARRHPLERGWELDYAQLDTIKKEQLTKGYLSRMPHLRKCTINFDDLTQKTNDFSPAQIKELCTKAAIKAVDADRKAVSNDDFNAALRLMQEAAKPAQSSTPQPKVKKPYRSRPGKIKYVLLRRLLRRFTKTHQGK